MNSKFRVAIASLYVRQFDPVVFMYIIMKMHDYSLYSGQIKYIHTRYIGMYVGISMCVIYKKMLVRICMFVFLTELGKTIPNCTFDISRRIDLQY